MRAQKYFLGQILKLAVMVLITAEVQSFTTPFGYSQVAHPVRRQPRNNVCRISFIEGSSDCDGTCQSKMELYPGESSLDFSDFLEPRQSDIQGLNHIYRGLAIKKLIQKSCKDDGGMLIIPQQCSYGIANQHISNFQTPSPASCAQMKTPEYLSRFSDPDYRSEQTRAISEMGNKIDFQRKFNFLIKELNGNNPSQDNAFPYSFPYGKDFYNQLFGKDYCPGMTVCDLEIAYNRGKTAGDFSNIADFKAQILEKFSKNEQEITAFLSKDPLFFVGARPEHHIYPVFESLRKSVIGEQEYQSVIDEIYDGYNQGTALSLPHSMARTIKSSIDDSEETEFLRQGSLSNSAPKIHSTTKPIDAPSFEENLRQIRNISRQNNVETLTKLCDDGDDGISLGQLMNSPGLEVEAKQYLKPNQQQNLDCFKNFLQTTESDYNNTLCMMIGISGVVALVPGAQFMALVSSAGGLLCDYNYGSIREYMDMSNDTSTCHQAFQFFNQDSPTTSSSQVTNCSREQITEYNQQLNQLIPWIAIEATMFPMAILDTLNDMKRVFRLNRSQLQKIGREASESLTSQGKHVTMDAVQNARVLKEELVNQLKQQKPGLRMFTSEEILRSLSNACQ